MHYICNYEEWFSYIKKYPVAIWNDRIAYDNFGVYQVRAEDYGLRYYF